MNAQRHHFQDAFLYVPTTCQVAHGFSLCREKFLNGRAVEHAGVVRAQKRRQLGHVIAHLEEVQHVDQVEDLIWV